MHVHCRTLFCPAPSVCHRRRYQSVCRRAVWGNGENVSTQPIRHPEYQRLLEERYTLQQTLKLLAEEWCWITQVVNPELRNRYFQLFGELEQQLHHISIRYAKVKYFAELLWSRVSHGQEITRELVLRCLQLCNSILEHRTPTPLSEESPKTQGEGELKQLYWQLVKKLHPDRSGSESPEYQKYWNLLQQAYKTKNASLLKTLCHIVLESTGAPSEEPAPSLETLQLEVETLRQRVAYQRKKLEKLKNDVPYRWKELLDDPEWQMEHRKSLEEEIQSFQQHLAHWNKRVEQILGLSAERFLSQLEHPSDQNQKFNDTFQQQTYFGQR